MAANVNFFGGIVGNLRLGVNVNERTMKVERVDSGTLAAMLGMKAGDRISSINGIPPVNLEGLHAIMNALASDDSIEVGVRRASELVTLGPIALSAVPRSAQGLTSVPTGAWKPEPDGGYRFWNASGPTERWITASQREILLLEDLHASLVRLEDSAAQQRQAIRQVEGELARVNNKLVVFILFFIVIPIILAIVIGSSS